MGFDEGAPGRLAAPAGAGPGAGGPPVPRAEPGAPAETPPELAVAAATAATTWAGGGGGKGGPELAVPPVPLAEVMNDVVADWLDGATCCCCCCCCGWADCCCCGWPPEAGVCIRECRWIVG